MVDDHLCGARQVDSGPWEPLSAPLVWVRPPIFTTRPRTECQSAAVGSTSVGRGDHEQMQSGDAHHESMGVPVQNPVGWGIHLLWGVCWSSRGKMPTGKMKNDLGPDKI